MATTTTEWILKLVDDITAPMRSVHEAARDTSEAARDVASGIEDIHEAGSRMPGTAEKIGAAAFVFNQVSDAVGRMNGELKGAIAPGEQFQYSLAEMSAITGQTGEGLDALGEKAKGLAEKYGVNAAGSVESFKLLLSQLSPDLANNSEALGRMTENVMVLSKTMKNDTTAAAQVLTAAMNQYGVSLHDPIAAADEMSRMMNIMAAAAREGSAELPQQKAALEQCGMAANAANVSFAETAAAIQVLDKAGRVGSEGGVALRNVLATLAQGRMLPKDVQAELSAAGISIEGLTNKSASLSERLSLLKPIMQDDALLSKMFGKENQVAALALLNGTEQMDKWKQAIEGTNTAYEQAAIMMDTNIEKQQRMNSWIDNLKISVFGAIASFTPFITIAGDALTSASSFGFAVYGLSVILKKDLWTGLWAGIRGIGSWVVKCAAGTVASVKFGIASVASFGSFKAMAVSACRAVSAAIVSIPIIGWIAGIVAALAAVATYFYNTSESFRGAVWGVWNVVKTVFSGIGDYVGEVLGGIWHLLKGVFNPANWFDDSYNFSDGIDRLLDADKEFGEKVGKAFAEGRQKGIDDFRQEKAAEEKEKNDEFNIVDNPDDPLGIGNPLAPTGGLKLSPAAVPAGTVALSGSGTKAVNLSDKGISGGTGGGARNVTMNVTFNQTFHADGNGNVSGLAEQVLQKITALLRDATVATT